MRTPRPKASKGERPQFLDDPDCERLLNMVMALAGEVSLLGDKFDTLARVAAEKGQFGLADLEAYVPDEAVRAVRAARREAMLGRVLRIVEADAERAAKPPRPYGEIMALVADPEGRVS
jgi:hypothetical protein